MPGRIPIPCSGTVFCYSYFSEFFVSNSDHFNSVPVFQVLSSHRLLNGQVQVITRKVCEPLEEDAFRPILHHYDGPKFRLELSVPEVCLPRQLCKSIKTSDVMFSPCCSRP